MTGPRNYGRSAPSTFGRKTEKQESRLEYEARIAREERERTEYFKKVAKLMKERTGMKKNQSERGHRPRTRLAGGEVPE